MGQRDAVMAGLILAGGPEHPTHRGSAFETLARSIVGQQISVAAAASIWGRICGLLPAIEPGAVLQIPRGAFRSCGLSERKVDYLIDLARHFDSGLIDPANWPEWTDENVISDLMRILGVGRWTAEMFLIFHLHRSDVFSAGDAGLRRAIEFYYGLGQPMEATDMIALADGWRPWRTVASWYLWRSLEPVPVQY